MYQNQKVSIYKGIIQYLLDSTAYPLQRIANLSNSPIRDLKAIYIEDRLPFDSKAEINLVKLFLTVIDMELKGQWKAHLQFSKIRIGEHDAI